MPKRASDYSLVSSFKPVESKETLAEQVKVLEAENKAIKGLV